MLHGLRRRESFVAAMTEAGLSIELIEDTDFSAAQAASATRRLLERESATDRDRLRQ